MVTPWPPHARRRQLTRAANTVVVAVMLAFSTGSSMPSDQAGDLRIVGSRAMAPAITDWTVLFQRQYPKVTVTTFLIGDGVAAGALANNRADIAPLSRSLIDQERSLIGKVQPIGIPVGAATSGRRDSRWAYLYVARQADTNSQALALAFVRTALSQAGQAQVTGPFAPLPDQQRHASLNQLARLGRTPQPDL